MKRLTVEFVRKEFEKEGYTLLTNKYINNGQKLEYICPEGHRGNITFNSWKQGHRCKTCGIISSANKQKLSIDFIRRQFEKEGYILLSDNYEGCNSKLKYICPRGHKGSITFNSWRRGHRCRICGIISSVNKRRLSIKFIKEQFEKEGYTLLTNKYINNNQKLEYICPKGHRGSITWACWSVGNRCLECCGNKKKTIDFIRKEFKKEGYTLLTKKYKNAHQKLEYICPKGHRGVIKWNYWQQGNRCRICANLNMIGKNNPNWNPNLTDYDRSKRDKKRRHILGYDKWSYEVKKRDKFTCQVCHQMHGNLVSHHLESYNNNPALRTALSNGVCLCEKCHKNFHHQYGYGNNTKEQFEEFKRRVKNENNFKKS